MGPVIKTYGSYKPKRKGLPKYVVKETLETSGNIFSALHIDKLKVMRGGDKHKSKNEKTTKTSAVRDFKPTFDDSLDNTFDKIVKLENDASGNRIVTNVGSKTHSPNSNKCWTCGCVPSTNMAFHVLYECKEDSYYNDPSPNTLKYLKRREKQVKKTIEKDSNRRKLKVQKSPVGVHLKKGNDTKKEKTVIKNEGHVISPSKHNNPFRTPNIKDTLLRMKSSTVITSTPEWCARRHRFSLEASPILAVCTDQKIIVQEHSLHTTNVPNKEQPVINNMTIVIENSFEEPQAFADNFRNDMKTLKDYCVEPEVLSDDFRNEMKTLKDYCVEPHVLTDDFRNEMKTLKDYCVEPQVLTDDFRNETIFKNSCSKPQVFSDNFQEERKEKSGIVSGEIKSNISAHQSCGIIESSIRQSSLYPPHGYITKRRMWRKTRRTAFNLSVDMFKSSNKSIFDNHTNGHESSRIDKLQVVTSRSDKSFHSRKEQTLAHQHFSISCDVRENDSVVKLLVNESIMECGNNSSICEMSYIRGKLVKNSDVYELSRQLKVNLSLLPSEVVKGKLVQSDESDIDMFSGLSEQNSHIESFKSSSLFEAQMCVSPFAEENNSVISQIIEKHAVPSFHSTKDDSLSVDESVREKSVRSDIVESTDVSFDLVLKPCYVKLHKCDTQTITDVMYTSQRKTASIASDSNPEILNESNHSISSDGEHTSDIETVVKLPLAMLGKLDKITIRSSSKKSQQSLESIVNEGKLLEQTVEKLKDLLTEEKRTAVEQLFVEDVIEKNLDDFNEVLSRCGQTEPLSFLTCYPESMLPKCRKIGEGAYGEVFLYNGEKQKTVIKIIPVEGDIEINAAVQKKFWEIKPEVIVAQELSSLRKSKNGKNYSDVFNEVLAVRCVRGKYPQWMLDLWHAYDEEQGSENDCPDVFGDNQLFIILELAHGGQDLESFEFASADQAVAAIAQIALALAVAESEIEFEHRDLHWGNVLIAPSKAKVAHFALGGNKYKVPTKGIKVSVIDFTMSRMTMPSTGENMYYDFGHDEELFAAQGDYQCDIYRLMRERTRNNWSVYEPFTNVLWLHYLLDKMCSMVIYRNPNTKLHKQAMAKLENMRDSVLAYSSATAFTSTEFFKSSRIL